MLIRALCRDIGAVIVVIVASICIESDGELIDPSQFAHVLRDVANNGLGVDKIQDYFNSLSYTNTGVDGSSLATEISSSLSSKFNGPIQALDKLKAAVKQDIASFESSTNIVECCRANGTHYNERFRGTVNINEACITISENSPDKIRYPTRRIMEVMKENYRDNPQLKWQYLGTEDGILLNYPSFKVATCGDYDARFRPFYVSTVTPVQKDVVIVIDRSGSMSALHGSMTLIQTAKQAAITVLQTLNPNDRFSVVSFSSNSEILGSSDRDCISVYELSEATTHNINFFEQKIKELSLDGLTNYEVALDTAFKFFESSPLNFGGEKRERVILFLTDGEKTAGGDPLTLIAQRNGELGNKVVILTYGLGTSLPAYAQTMLSNIAKQVNSSASEGEIQTGVFEHIKDPSKLRTAMASYYDRFSRGNQQQAATFTVPYYSLFGLGLLTSLCLPVYNPDNSLFGVVCTDLTMANLVSDITYFKQGENSYSFIIDGRGRTLMHPLLPLPSQATGVPIYVGIQHLERESDAAEVISSMKSGDTGSKSFVSSRTLSRGDVYYEGINNDTMTSTYYWTPVLNSNFSLCIVVGSGDVQATMHALQPNPKSFFYHRTDLQGNKITSCIHFNRFSTKDTSAVMITPGGFVNPSLYLETEETNTQVDAYAKFLTGKTNTNPGFKPSIINSVTATYSAEITWRANPESGNMVIWRYIGTTDGVMRVYPAIQLPKNYDHTRRPWYERSISNKGKLVLSAPYGDLWGSGFLVTLSTAITEPGSSESTMAIVATDFTISYLYTALISIPQYNICRDGEYKCFLVDDSGFIILHPDFNEPTTKAPMLENVHITYKEPAIADDLVTNNNMVRTYCIDFESIKEQYSYRITTPTNGLDRQTSYAKYEIRPVENTNVFIVIQKKAYIPPQRICCQNYGTAPTILACRTSSCDCLCYKDVVFDYCNNEYEHLIDAGPTCSPRTPALETESIEESDQIEHLPLCYETNCDAKLSESDCHSTSGCSWCSKDKNMIALSSPYCTRQEACYFGIQSLSQCPAGICEVTTEHPGYRDEKEDTVSLIGIVIGAILAVIVAISFGVFIYKKRNVNPHRSPETPSRTTTSWRTNSATDNPAFSNQQALALSNLNNHQSSETYYSNRSNQRQLSVPQQRRHEAPPTYDESQSRTTARDLYMHH